MPDRLARGADMIGMITGQHRNLTKTIAAAGPIRERRGPESTMGGSMAATGGPLKKGVKMKAGVCANCENSDPTQWRTDYKNGNYVCKACGAIDFNRVLSTEEESRVFADDTAADKEQKKRAEYRADGGLGSYIAGGVERRGQLPNPAIQRLQRTQLRLQSPPAELLAAAEQSNGAGGTAAGAPQRKTVSMSKQLERYKSEIDKLGEKLDIPDTVRDMAKMLADEWAALFDAHKALCNDKKCHLHEGTPPRAADAAAGAFLQRASKRFAEGQGGEGATRSLQEIEKEIALASRSAMRSFHKALQSVLTWDKKRGCNPSATGELLVAPAGAGGLGPAPGGGLHLPGGSAGAGGGSSTAKGLVSRVVGHLCVDKRQAAMQIEQHVFGLLDWISAESLLTGKQPKTVAAAALALGCSELLKAGAPAMGEIELPTVAAISLELATQPATVQTTIDAIKAQREAAVLSGMGGAVLARLSNGGGPSAGSALTYTGGGAI